MRFRLFIISFLGLTLFGQSQYHDYLSSSDFNSVLISDNTVFKIYDIENSEEVRKYKALILNDKANALREIVLHYDQFTEISSFDLKVFKVDGTELDRIKLKELNDYGLSNGIASDNRVKYVSLDEYEYPFIVEVEYSIKNEGSLFYPKWIPQAEEGLLVENAVFKVEDWTGQGVRYLPVNMEKPSIKDTLEGKEYAWEVSDLKPYEYDRWNFQLDDYTPYLLLAPFDFKMDEYVGKMETWASFGKWISKLNAERSSLDGLDLAELDSMISSKMTDQEKTAIVYNYLQTHSRYVSIQLGIGGWQPFPASYVHEKKYGDCKALSNYTVALLSRYGVKAFYALINAGKYANKVPEKFPNAHFNHAVAIVPFDGDTTVLECTSQTNPYGYSGTFTSDRNALLITESGGSLIKTKKYLPSENAQETSYKISMDANSRSLFVDMMRVQKGLSIEESQLLRQYYESDKENEKWFVDVNNFGSINLNHFKLLPRDEGRVPSCGYQSTFEKSAAIKKAGSRLLIDESFFFDSKLRDIIADSISRPIRIRYGYSQKDSLKVEIPRGFFPKVFDDVNFDTSYGTYSKKYIPSEGQLLIIRNFVFKNGNYLPDEFEDFKAFVNNVISNDRQKIVLLGNT